MSRRFVQISDGSLVEVTKDYVAPSPAAPTVRGDTPGYLSHATGKWVEGAVQRREDLAVSGCRPFEGHETEQKEAARARTYNEQAREQATERELRKIAPHMPSDVRRMLQGEEVTGHAPSATDVQRMLQQRRR